MLELLDIPYTGCDPATLSIALDKALAKRIVRQHGIHTPNFQLMVTGKERLSREFTRFPLLVKPVAEGSSKGVVSSSVCHTEAELREVVRDIAGKYQQPALVEEYISGREFTVGLLGERRPKVLPPMEIVFLDESEKTPVYSFQHKLDWNDRIRYDVPARLEPDLLEKLRTAGRAAFMALGCRDVARIDFRMDERGRVYFLECNPLARADAGLERLGPHRPRGGHGLPDADWRDSFGRHPPLQGTGAAQGGGPRRAQRQQRQRAQQRDGAARAGAGPGSARRQGVAEVPRGCSFATGDAARAATLGQTAMADAPTEPRVRARALELPLGRFRPGKHNAITDVEGVLVGHTTIIRGEGRLRPGHGPVRTGVTAILPSHGNIFMDRLHGGSFVLNGAGEVSGLTQVMEWGLLETPILLTNTMSVGAVSDAVARTMVERYPGIGDEHDVIIPVVGECDDSWLNDIAGVHVHEDHVRAAIAGATSGAGGRGERRAVGRG